MQNAINKPLKAKIAFWLTLILCAISFVILMLSINSHILWKILASSTGFVGFLILAVLIFPQISKRTNS